MITKPFLLVPTLLLLFICSGNTYGTSALFFRMTTTSPVCFVEDIGFQSEVVVIKYKRISHLESSQLTVQLTVKSPSNKLVLEAHIPVDKNTITFKPIDGEEGNYEICFREITYKVSRELYVDISVSIDHHDRSLKLPSIPKEITRQSISGTDNVVMSYTDEYGQQKDTSRSASFIHNLYNMLVDVEVLNAEIRHEIDHFEEISTRMRRTSESIFTTIWYVSIITMCVVGATAYMQFLSLTTFLKRKKLV
eukprot:Tbor_TRINITY_DN5305_c1_g7::TRINITY_DN5305_c1_g7_i1::g.4862::m.4862/K20346/TMED4_9_11; p24 family protein alpha